MPRNIVLCCDGTANEFAVDRTNVLKLYYCLVQDPERQIVYYHPGLGTMEPPGALGPLTKRATRWLGLAFGSGLESDVRDAYVFLMNNFQPDDRLYMFGFSRGAYTARAVASLLCMYGLLPKGNESFVPYAVRMLTAVNSAPEGERSVAFKLACEFRETFDPVGRCRPHLVGIWDTVSSVGWVEHQLRLPYSSNNPFIAHARHAVAIDERRAFFRTNLWWPSTDPEKAGPKDLKQVWFPGVHCDVGGGYPECESGLSKIALKWMIDEAVALNLLVDEERRATMLGDRGKGFVKPDPNGCMHESLSGAWWLAEIVPKRHYDRDRKSNGRRMNLGRSRELPPTPSVHAAAWQRGGGYSSRLPDDAVSTE
ncbi:MULTISPECIES: DUF2235 domain-containing protein [unclassified Bradyrhizobium]|uniref:T6SS phospholipase effector Tle1-like catalytic domain-containing protein n=1 Tax=unclassified Bradyrhizobium TaxID=2631580 RepID=UPI000715A90D|nr:MULTISPECIES: DUF2235 domain-containing protein [unclassified Bradyrhizobium]KQT21361.1 hypothetical protein ASG57_04370 [Bradyrhizobium sp. Leaf396]